MSTHIDQGNTLRARLRRLLAARSMTQEQLARQSGMTLSGVAHVLNGRVEDPRMSTLVRLAEALDVPVSELLGEASS